MIFPNHLPRAAVAEPFVRGHLHPVIPLFTRSLATGFKLWCNLPPETTLGLSPSLRARFIQEKAVHQAKHLVDGLGSVETHTVSGATSFFVGCAVEVRLKLLDRYGISRNYVTKRQRKWSQHEHLPGMDPAVRVTIGYQLDPSGSVIERMRVTCPDGLRANHWSFDVTWGEEATGSIILLGPAPDGAPPIITPSLAAIRERGLDKEEAEQT